MIQVITNKVNIEKKEEINYINVQPFNYSISSFPTLTYLREYNHVDRELYGEQLNGVIDNNNKLFTTTYDYLPGTTMVYMNGLLLKKDIDYYELNNKQIQFAEAPRNIGFVDNLYIVYLR